MCNIDKFPVLSVDNYLRICLIIHTIDLMLLLFREEF